MSIFYKNILTISFFLLISMAITSSFYLDEWKTTLNQLRTESKKAMEAELLKVCQEHGVELAAILEKSLWKPLADKDFKKISHPALFASKQPLLKRLIIFDDQKNVLFNTEEVTSKPQFLFSRLFSKRNLRATSLGIWREGNSLYFHKNLFLADSLVGGFCFELSLADLQQSFTATQNRLHHLSEKYGPNKGKLAGIFFFLMVAGCWSAHRLTRHVTRPLHSVKEIIHKLKDGNFDVGIPVSNNCDSGPLFDEIRALGKHLKNATVCTKYIETVFSGMQDPMVVVSRNGRIQAANHPFTSLADVEEKSLVEKKIWDYLEIREEGRKHFLGRGQAITGMVCHLKAGTRPELMVSVLKIPQVDQENPSYVFILRDISKQKWLAEMIRYNATHDSLTGLANRAFFLRKLENLVKSSKNEKNGFAAVLFISLDRFKYINDSYGHRFGDAVLRAFSERIRHLVRDGDAVSRLGGDEFIVLFENLKSEGEAWRIALQLHQKLSRPFSIEWKEISLESSIGITCDWQDFEDVSQILGNADLAMREAKRKTSEKVVLYTESMRSQTRALFFLESDLRSAIKNKTIDIHFQPITCMVEKNLRGFEVLARWDHPEYGMIPPSLFIPLAERVGLIEPLEWIIFEKVFAKRQKWRQKFPGRPFYLAVNVSGFQLGRISFPVYIGRSFQQFGICPGEIVFEVTESMLMQNPTVAKRVLGELKKAGAKLALDDFGTGYSSLSHLSSFPFDFLKIDQSFVRGACKNPESHHGEIIETISQLGHSLGMEVVVEGVETDQDMERVSVLGIDAWQGFLSSVPTDAAGAELILQESHFFKKENYFAMSS